MRQRYKRELDKFSVIFLIFVQFKENCSKRQDEETTYRTRKENSRTDDSSLLPEKEKNAVLCPDCEELLRYAHARLDHCPFGERKSSCKKCTVHCYKPAMRERMRLVMRFSGPRMLLYAPWAAIRHLLNL